MKKIFFSFFALVTCAISYAQLVQGTIKAGTTPNSVIVAIRPNATFSGQISGLNITLQVPAAGIVPAPVASIRNNPLSANVPTAAYVTAVSTENSGGTNYINYLFVANPTGTPAFNFTNNVEVDLVEIQFASGPTGVRSQVRLANVPNGGNLMQAYFYIEINGTDRTNQASMFYGSSASNNAAGYTAYSFVPINNIALPLRWKDFTLQRQLDDAVLNWNVSSEEETVKYVVERSSDGVNFTALGEVVKSAGNGEKVYRYDDKNISSIGSKVLYYRIRSVDIQSRASYSATKNIRLDTKGEISLFPNPAKDGFTLTIPYLNPSQQKVQLHLVNSIGQIVEQRSITKLAASNYYYNLQNSLVVSGDYLLKIYEDGQLTETRRVAVHK